MKLGGLGIWEILVILVVVLLIFGPKNLPKLGKTFGKTVKNVRDGMSDTDEAQSAPIVETVDDQPASVLESVTVDALPVTWTCTACGDAANTGKFCQSCGQPQPVPVAAPVAEVVWNTDAQ